jgi:hypothetical protein
LNSTHTLRWSTGKRLEKLSHYVNSQATEEENDTKKMIKACNTNAVNWYYEPDVITLGRKIEKDSFPDRHLF